MSENSTSIVVQVVGESLSNSTSALIPAAAAAAEPQVSSTVSNNLQATTSISSDSAFISIIWPTNHSSTTSATITTTSKTPTVHFESQKDAYKSRLPSLTSLIKLHFQHISPEKCHLAVGITCGLVFILFPGWTLGLFILPPKTASERFPSVVVGGTGGNGRYNTRRIYGNMTGSTRFLGPSAYCTSSSPQKLLGTNSRSFASSAGETAVHTTLDPESRHGTLARPKKVVTFYESPVRSVASSSEDSFPPSYASKTIATAPPAVIVAVNDDKEKDPVVMHQKAGDFFPAEKQKHIRSSTGGSEVSCEFETWDSEVVGKYYETSLYSESDYSSGK
ncbi:hypothetical protein BDR26DRAFT_887660 [Obelidium mucronatum]|nr:hypothetical protein BDR26DRAFT_887660 [Obelidium mucronatum]